MRHKIDKENNGPYFRLDELAIVEAEKVQPGVILGFDANRHVIGVEILARSLGAEPEKLPILQFETVG